MSDRLRSALDQPLTAAERLIVGLTEAIWSLEHNGHRRKIASQLRDLIGEAQSIVEENDGGAG